jgi:hypothetical protein
MHASRSHDAVIRVYDEAGNLIELLQGTLDLLILKALTPGQLHGLATDRSRKPGVL